MEDTKNKEMEDTKNKEMEDTKIKEMVGKRDFIINSKRKIM
jgi:hypothetical protein